MRTTIKFLEFAIGGALLLSLGAYVAQGLAILADAIF